MPVMEKQRETTATNRPAPSAPPMPQSEGIRDTIESIVLAFILAFVFRAFLVEAFVIPTGSMAPGLMGQHVQHRCDLCGYPFVFGIREDVVSPQGELKQAGTLKNVGFSVACPNCGYSGGGNSGLNTPDAPLVASAGDRILVLKWPYDIGGDLLGPKRWDVVVFKEPQDSDQNYIKRLIGLPGEVVTIIDGDIYSAPVEDVPADVVETLSRPVEPYRPETPRLTAEQEARLASVLHIRRKTDVAQRRLWMLHYDHSFQPPPDVRPSGDFDPPRWEPEDGANGGWDAEKPRVVFRPPDDEIHWLRLAGKPVRDRYAYNDVSVHQTRHPDVPVGDVRVRMVLVPTAANGEIRINLRKGPDDFVATLEAEGKASLIRMTRQMGRPVPTTLRSTSVAPLTAHRPVELQFEIVDYRVALQVDGETVVQTDDAQYAPDVAALMAEPPIPDASKGATIRLGARRMPLEIDHLVVERDVYYRSDFELSDDSAREGVRNPFVHYPGWGTTRNPILLRADPPEYFCLGDNSPQSKDSRLWWESSPMLEARGNYRMGTVPGDQMIGRAFFVYWPAGIRLTPETPAVIPNLGRMRIIR